MHSKMVVGVLPLDKQVVLHHRQQQQQQQLLLCWAALLCIRVGR